MQKSGEKLLQLKKASAIGTDSFEELVVSSDSLFVDKTLFLEDFLGSGEKVALIQRQRRSGKSLVLSMLEQFLSNHPIKSQGYQSLFDKTLIAENTEFCKEHQGQHPVILISLKGVQPDNFEVFLDAFRGVIQELYEHHEYLREKLNNRQKGLFDKYLDATAGQAELGRSLKVLTNLLQAHFKKKVIVLIDEYDASINYAHMKLLTVTNRNVRADIKSYCEQLVNFYKNFYGNVMKSNNSLEKGLMMGILRVSKHEMLSNLNNLRCHGVLDSHYGQYFGFTEPEVIKALEESGLGVDKLKTVQAWYNGYSIGQYTLYNPWSVMNFISDKGTPQSYWVLTGSIDNTVRQVMLGGGDDIQSTIRALMVSQKPIRVKVSSSVVFEHFIEDISDVQRAQTLWALLLSSGYLTAEGRIDTRSTIRACQVRIPNHEVRDNFQVIYSNWLCKKISKTDGEAMISQLFDRQFSLFCQGFSDQIVSLGLSEGYHKATDYQALLVGFFTGYSSPYQLVTGINLGISNGFSVVLAPYEEDVAVLVILNYVPQKNFNQTNKTHLEQLSRDSVLCDIDATSLAYALRDFPHIKRLFKVGLTIAGKTTLIASRENTLKNLSEKTTISVTQSETPFIETHDKTLLKAKTHNTYDKLKTRTLLKHLFPCEYKPLQNKYRQVTHTDPTLALVAQQWKKLLSHYKTNYSKKSKKIFISYAWASRQYKNFDFDQYKRYEFYIEKIAHDLRSAGFEIYLDRWNDAGNKNFAQDILSHIQKADIYLMILSPLYLHKFQSRTKDLTSNEHIVRMEASVLNQIALRSTSHREKMFPLFMEKMPQNLELLTTVNRGYWPDQGAKSLLESSYFTLMFELLSDMNNHKHHDQWKTLVDGFYDDVGKGYLTDSEVKRFKTQEVTRKAHKQDNQLTRRLQAIDVLLKEPPESAIRMTPMNDSICPLIRSEHNQTSVNLNNDSAEASSASKLTPFLPALFLTIRDGLTAFFGSSTTKQFSLKKPSSKFNPYSSDNPWQGRKQQPYNWDANLLFLWFLIRAYQQWGSPSERENNPLLTLSESTHTHKALKQRWNQIEQNLNVVEQYYHENNLTCSQETLDQIDHCQLILSELRSDLAKANTPLRASDWKDFLYDTAYLEGQQLIVGQAAEDKILHLHRLVHTAKKLMQSKHHLKEPPLIKDYTVFQQDFLKEHSIIQCVYTELTHKFTRWVEQLSEQSDSQHYFGLSNASRAWHTTEHTQSICSEMKHPQLTK